MGFELFTYINVSFK